MELSQTLDDCLNFKKLKKVSKTVIAKKYNNKSKLTLKSLIYTQSANNEVVGWFEAKQVCFVCCSISVPFFLFKAQDLRMFENDLIKQ